MRKAGALLVAAFLAGCGSSEQDSPTGVTNGLIAYTYPSDQAQTGDELMLVESDGSRKRILFGGSSPAWSPDGSKVAFDRWEGEDLTKRIPRGLAVIAPDGTGLTMLVRATDRADIADPAWSPDGTRIAFAMREATSASGSKRARSTSSLPGTTTAWPAPYAIYVRTRTELFRR